MVPKLAARGHELFGMTRSESKREHLRSMGATPVVADALDPDAVATAVAESDPEVIVHQLTALSSSIDMRHLDRDLELTNRLRTDGTDHLLAAGRAIGIKRFVAQSSAGCPFARSGGRVKSEDDPLDPAPPHGMRRALEAIRHLEAAVTGAEWTTGIVLRYGGFYGPGTSIAPEGEHFELIRKRRSPVEDAADATVAAVEHGPAGSTTS